MPGKKGLPTRTGARMMDDPALRDLYLSKIREKHGRNESARLVGLDPSTVWRYVEANPWFLDEIQEAEAAKVEAAHKFWFDVMSDEDAPLKDRLKASELLERTFGRDNRKDAKIEKHTEVVVISGDQMERVIAMQERLALAAGTVIDVEVVDDDG